MKDSERDQYSAHARQHGQAREALAGSRGRRRCRDRLSRGLVVEEHGQVLVLRKLNGALKAVLKPGIKRRRPAQRVDGAFAVLHPRERHGLVLVGVRIGRIAR